MYFTNELVIADDMMYKNIETHQVKYVIIFVLLFRGTNTYYKNMQSNVALDVL